MKFPVKAGPKICPVEGCSGGAATKIDMRVQFWHQHIQDTMVILEKGNLLRPRCSLCAVLVPWRLLKRVQWQTIQCKKGVKRKRRRLAVE